jgi:hypothetical protein
MSHSCFTHFKELTYSAKIKIFARLMGKFIEGVQNFSATTWSESF